MKIWEERQKKNTFIVIILALLITFPAIPILLYQYGIQNPAQTNEDITLEIKQGSSVHEVAGNLKDAGLINSTALFKIYLKVNGLEKNIQAGVYLIPPMTSMEELVDVIQYGRNDVTIMYIEGWRVEQLAELLVRKLKNIDYKSFVVEAREYEGYLFPDTYFINVDIEQEELMEVLRGTFAEKTEELLSTQNLREAGMTKEEAVILASIVEREAAEFKDRKIIAGILLKRLREGMRLEADATTQYTVALNKHCVPEVCRIEDAGCDLAPNTAVCETGLDNSYLEDIKWWPKELTQYDLDYNSPYNTRSAAGLPPAPISSFGLEALESVIDHTPTGYYFYLTDADGVTHYAKDLEGHIQNMDTYLR